MTSKRYVATVFLEPETITNETNPFIAVRKGFDALPGAIAWAERSAETITDSNGHASVWDETENREVFVTERVPGCHPCGVMDSRDNSGRCVLRSDHVSDHVMEYGDD